MGGNSVNNSDKKPEVRNPAPDFFKNPEVNAKYTAPMGVDSIIHLPGKYSGHLSGISLDVAAALVSMKDNQVEEKK